MEINENKFMSKAKSFLVLVLFTMIYFFFQKTIYPALAFLFWLIFGISFSAIIFNSLTLLNIPEWLTIFFNISFSVITLIIVLGFIFYLGYFLCSEFLKKMNKTLLGSVMMVILIYFLYKIFTEPNEDTTMFAPTQREIYIFCTVSHIFYTIGVFFSDKVKKILDRIKFKRKNK
ncbi:MerT protein [Leptotrichia massiliensis]